MKVPARRIVWAAVLAGVAAWASAARAQSLPASPVPVTRPDRGPRVQPAPDRPGPAPPARAPPPAVAAAPPAPAPGVCPPPPPPPPPGCLDPGRDGWGPFRPPAGFGLVFFTWEFEVMGPAVKNQLVGHVPHPDGTID